MALQYQMIPVSLTGIDTKTDDFILQPGRMTDAKNVWMDRTGKIQTRYGFDKFGSPLADALTISDWHGDILLWRDTAVGKIDSNRITYTQSPYLAGKYEAYDVGGELDGSQEFSYAEGPDYGIFVKITVDYSTSPPSTIGEIQAVDLQSRKIFYFEQAAATKIGCVATDTGVAVVRLTNTDIRIDHFEGFTGAGLPDKPGINNVALVGAYTLPILDLAHIDGYIAVVYSPAVQTRVATINLSTFAITDTQISTLQSNNVSICRETTNVGLVAFFELFSYVLYSTTITMPGTAGTPFTVINYGGLGDWPDNITVASDNSTRRYLMSWGANAPAAGTYTSPFAGPRHTEYWTAFGSTPSGPTIFYECQLASRAFYYDSNPYCYLTGVDDADDVTNTCVSLAQLQSSSALFTDFLLPSRSKPYAAGSMMSHPQVDSTSILTALPYSGNRKDSAKVVLREAVGKPVFGYWNGVLLNNVTPHLSYFDGRYQKPAGFPTWPKIESATASGTTFGTFTGTFGFVATWEKLDSQGNVWRSAPSLVSSVVAVGNDAFVVDVYFPPFFDETDQYRLVLYRTQANGTLYYKLGEYDPYDLSTAPVVSISDSTLDSDLGDNPLLYTDGGILENVLPPAVESFAVTRDRVFVISAEDNAIFTSKLRLTGEGVGFNDALLVSINTNRSLTSLGVMDEKVLAFGEDQSWLIYGVGPDDLGSGQFEAQVLSDDIGCIDPRSVILGDAGIYFQSKKALWLYGRDLAQQPIGIPVDAYKDETIVGACSPSDRLQHWFYTSSGTILVYDEYHGFWTRFETGAMKAGTIIDDKPTLLYATGEVAVEDTTSYQDEGVSYECKLDLGWINFAGLQGFKKVRRFSIVGESQAADFNMVIKASYDFVDTVRETFTAANSTVKPTGTAYQWEAMPQRHRCESIQLSMSWTAASTGASVVGLAFEVGAIPGIARRTNLGKRVKGV